MNDMVQPQELPVDPAQATPVAQPDKEVKQEADSQFAHSQDAEDNR